MWSPWKCWANVQSRGEELSIKRLDRGVELVWGRWLSLWGQLTVLVGAGHCPRVVSIPDFTWSDYIQINQKALSSLAPALFILCQWFLRQPTYYKGNVSLLGVKKQKKKPTKKTWRTCVLKLHRIYIIIFSFLHIYASLCAWGMGWLHYLVNQISLLCWVWLLLVCWRCVPLQNTSSSSQSKHFSHFFHGWQLWLEFQPMSTKSRPKDILVII